MKKTIGIIGGNGQMGKAFAEYFSQKSPLEKGGLGDLKTGIHDPLSSNSYEIIISDLDTDLTNKKLAQKSDIVIISVPIEHTEKIITEVAPYMKKDALLMDFTSVKKSPTDSMREHFEGAIIGAHPMFGPRNVLPGQTMVLCPVRPENFLPEIRNLFSIFKIVEIEPEEHDKAMAYIQGLQHFFETVFGKVLEQSGVSRDTFLNLASPAYKIHMAVMARVLGQSASLSSHIVHGSKYAEEAIQDFLRIAHDLAQEKDYETFEEIFGDARYFFGDYCDVAKKETDEIIEMLLEKNRDGLTGEKEARYSKLETRVTSNEFRVSSQKSLTPHSSSLTTSLGILGPELTWSDLAAQKFFPKEKKKLYPNFPAIFSALEKKEIDVAFLPVENNISGSIEEVWDSIRLQSCEIHALYEFRIQHVLASEKKIPYEQVSHIFARDAALSQCSKFLGERLQNAEQIPVASTSEGIVRSQEIPNSAAVCSEEAARKNNLYVLAKDIAEVKENITRFAVVTKKKEECTGKQKNSENTITSIFFELKKNKPGALFHVLKIFSEMNKDMVRLESRPTGKKFSEYAFYVDFKGNLDAKFKNILKEETESFFVLGKNYAIIQSN